MRKKLILITEYYTNAWIALNNNNLKEAQRIIHNLMPTKLYDLSLDIQDNTKLLGREEVKDESLVVLFDETKHLIGKVDKELSKISTDGLEELKMNEELTLDELAELQEDKFNTQF